MSHRYLLMSDNSVYESFDNREEALSALHDRLENAFYSASWSVVEIVEHWECVMRGREFYHERTVKDGVPA